MSEFFKCMKKMLVFVNWGGGGGGGGGFEFIGNQGVQHEKIAMVPKGCNLKNSNGL